MLVVNLVVMNLTHSVIKLADLRTAFDCVDVASETQKEM